MIGSTVLIFFFFLFFLNHPSYSGLCWGPWVCLHQQKLSAAAFMLYRYAAGSSHSCLWHSRSGSRCAFPSTLLQHHLRCSAYRCRQYKHRLRLINQPSAYILHSNASPLLPVMATAKSQPENLRLRRFPLLPSTENRLKFCFLCRQPIRRL